MAPTMTSDDQFLVGIENPLFDRGETHHTHLALTEAKNEDAAILRFVEKVAVREESFVIWVGDRRNESFDGEFWERVMEDVSRQDELEVPDRGMFERQVRDFFGTHKDWAEIYLAHYWDEDQPAEAASQFPPEMLVYIWCKADNEGPFAVRVSDIPHI